MVLRRGQTNYASWKLFNFFFSRSYLSRKRDVKPIMSKHVSIVRCFVIEFFFSYFDLDIYIIYGQTCEYAFLHIFISYNDMSHVHVSNICIWHHRCVCYYFMYSPRLDGSPPIQVYISNLTLFFRYITHKRLIVHCSTRQYDKN